MHVGRRSNSSTLVEPINLLVGKGIDVFETTHLRNAHSLAFFSHETTVYRRGSDVDRLFRKI
jgi:hypothetical protein